MWFQNRLNPEHDKNQNYQGQKASVLHLESHAITDQDIH